MKITRIQADNILGLQSVDVTLPTTVALFAGRNGSGKSSLQEAVRMAITKTTVRDVDKKKDFGALVFNGGKAGGAVVTINDDTDQSFAFNMPKGDFVGPEISEPMRVALYGQRFAKMTADERRTFLFGLTKLKASAATVKPRMMSEKWGCNEGKIDAVLPLLRTGFPAVCAHAKEKATGEKGAWRQLTGETYGGVKAETWEAPLPELPAGDAAALADKVAGLDKNIAQLNESLGAIKNAQRVAADTATRRAALADSAGKVPNLVDQIERNAKDIAEYEPGVVELRQRATGTARVGLVHDMANYLNETLPSLASSNAAHAATELLARYTAEYGALGGKVDAEAKAALPEREQGLALLKSRAKNLQRDLDSAKQAQGQYDALAPAADATDASAEITEVQGMLDKAKADRAAAENARLDIEAVIKARAAAEGKTKAALTAHNEVLAWTKLADALAPDGIPAEMLGEALAPVNAALVQAAADTEWMQVNIGSDMAITAAGRAYNLLSESEQWRSDAMIAQVVAELSDVKVLMLDRVDVLDLPGRAQLLEWVDTLAFHNLVDTVLLFGTFKALPTGLADTVTAYWIDKGMIASTSAEQQAA